MRTLEELPEGKPAYIGAKQETLHCEDCGKDWTRFSRRGRKPPRCPECQSAKDAAKPIRVSLPAEVAGDRMALARAGKAQAKQERAKREAEEEAQRRRTIADQLPRIDKMWNLAFDFALKENTPEAWNRCETLMTSYVGSKASL